MFLDAGATVEKSCSLIAEAAKNGAQLVAFPEVYLPAFPLWSAPRAPLYNHEFFRRMAANSAKVDGPEIGRICAAARRRGVMVSYGFSDRKLVSPFWEKLVWAGGDGAGCGFATPPSGASAC